MPGRADNHIGPYRILRLIKQGGQGSVYLGYDKRLRRRVAIKVCSLPDRRGAKRRLLREAQMVAGIRSPKVVQVHDVIESSGHLALVMEYVPGCDLEQFLAAQQPTLASVLTVSADIAGALAVARQQGIVHGDLKAGNVLVTEAGRARLTDFGIARAGRHGGFPEQAAGSPSALSPEQFLGRPLDVRSDLFALGSLMYRMLSGQHPFYRDGSFEEELLLAGSPTPLRDIADPSLQLPPELDELVEQLLRANPDERLDNTRHVRQVLRALSADIPLASRNSLLQQARPYFRAEAAEDIPPQVPADLLREGRSRLQSDGGPLHRLWQQLPLSPAGRLCAGLGAALLGAVALVMTLQPTAGPVHIGEPLVQISPAIDLPGEVSSRWLVAQVSHALSDRVGKVDLSGPLIEGSGTTLHLDERGMRSAPLPPDQLAIELRCPEQFCVLALVRHDAGERKQRQVLLFPGMSIERWRDTVHAEIAALYP